MSDIPINFDTNAPDATREINAAEKATLAAAQASAKFDQVIALLTRRLQGEENALKKVSTAARDATKEMQRFQAGGAESKGRGTGGIVGRYFSDFGETAKVRTNVQQAILKMNRDVRERMEVGGGEAGQAFGKGFGKLLQKMGGSVGGIGRALGIGGGFGAAALGFVAMERAVSIANFALENHVSKLERAAQGALNFARAQKTALEMNQTAGVGVAQAQGTAITQLVGVGGQAALDKANGLARSGGFTFSDASSAVLAAKQRFGTRSDDALEIAARAARAGGTTLAENINGLGGDELDNPSLASARLLAVSRNQGTYSVDDLTATESRLGQNGITSDLTKIRQNLGATEVNGQGLISAGVMGSAGMAAEAKDPGGKYLLSLNNTAQQELDVLRQVRDNMGWAAKAWDWVTHPGNTVGRKVDVAEDTAILNAGGGAGH